MKKDYSAVKFEVSEELGEWMNCLYLKRTDGQKWDYDFIHHTESDGVGAITKILESEGHIVLEQPRTREMPKLSLLEKLKLLKSFIDLTKSVKIKWAIKRRDIRGIPQTFCLNLLSSTQTSAIHKKASLNNLSLNSWLFYHLDLACQELLLQDSSERKWISPINIRTKTEKKYGNNSASIILNILEKDFSSYSATNLHTQIRKYLESNLQWGSHLYSNMAKFIGKKGTLIVAKKIKEVGTGVFSNLGTWPLEGININEDAPVLYSRRIVIAPATQVLPVAATAWQWGEQLSLSLQLHPSLNLDSDVTFKLMKRWSELIEVPGILTIEQHQWQNYPECPRDKIIVK